MKHMFLILISIYTLVFLQVQQSAAVTTGQIAAEQFETANKAYAQSKYDEAIDRYRAIIAQHGFSPEVLLNLGNSYAENGQQGYAILHYLRGLSLSPGDDDLQGSLELARKNAGIIPIATGFTNTFWGANDMNQWALWALGGYISLVFLLVVNTFFPLKKGFLSGCLCIVAFICVCSVGVYQQHSRWSGAVVVNAGERILMSPFQNALSQGMLAEGSLLYWEKQHGKYHYIRDEKGRVGWVQSTAFKKISTTHITYSQDSAAQ